MWDRLATALECLLKGQAQEHDTLRSIAAQMGRLNGALQRENAHDVIEHDTSSTSESNPHDMVKKLGAPATSLTVLREGGGNLELSINGRPWFPVDEGDYLENETIETLRVRATAAATGTAKLRVGTRLEPRRC